MNPHESILTLWLHHDPLTCRLGPWPVYNGSILLDFHNLNQEIVTQEREQLVSGFN